MDIRAIRTDEEHRAALAAIEACWGAPEGTEEGDELWHTQAELAELLGSRPRASEVLARRRALTVEMIHKIGEAWKIPADLLVRPYKLEQAA
jgi:HTH-type transcriptional regulator / antitoxin HigA